MLPSRLRQALRVIVVAAVMAAGGLPFVASASAATSSVGAPLQSRPILDLATGVLTTTSATSGTGYVDSFVYHADRAAPTNFVVLTAARRVVYISPTVNVAVGRGIYTPSSPIPVVAGSLVGFYAPGATSIAFTAGGPTVTWSNFSHGTPAFGSTVSFGGSGARTYSLQATFTPATFSPTTFAVSSRANPFTAVTLADGEVASLTASGTWNNCGGCPLVSADGAGTTDSQTTLPSAPWTSLIYSTNGGSTWSFAGVGPTPIVGPGTLLLKSNDQPWTHDDNSLAPITVTLNRRVSTATLVTDTSWTSLNGGTVGTCEHGAWADSVGADLSPARYIWRQVLNGSCDAPVGTQPLQTTFTIPAGTAVVDAQLHTSVDNEGRTSINGTEVQWVVGFEAVTKTVVSPSVFQTGVNTWRIDGINHPSLNNPAGVAERLTLQYVGGTPQSVAFTSAAPAVASVGQTYTPTAVGGPSGQPVTFSTGAVTTSGACTYNGSHVVFTGGGVCAVTADQDGRGWYAAARPAHQLITVLAPQAISFPAQPQRRVGDVFAVAATGGTSGNPVTFTTTTPSICTTTAAGSVSAVAAGTCSITADQAGSATHDPALPVTQNVSVIPKAPTLVSVSPSSGSASGGTTITITGTNLTGGTLNGGEICATTPVFTDTTITCDTMAFVHGATWMFNVSTAGGQTGGLSFLFLGTASVVPDDQTITYGDPLPSFTSTVEGLPAGATVTTAAACGVSGSPTDVGTYEITCTGTEVSGALVSHAATATLTIAPRGINIAPSATQTYGGAPTFAYTASGMLPGDTVTGTLSCAGPSAALGVGTHPLSSCSGLSVTNASQYDITYLAGTVAVAPKPLQITASSASITYGDAIPAITPAYAGFVNGEDASVLISPASCFTAAGSSSQVGSYATACSGAAAANYAIGYGAGSIDITRATLTITASSATAAYGDPVLPVTPLFEGFVNGEGPGVLTEQPVCGSAASTGSDAGTYTTSCASAAADSYTIDYEAGSIEIERVPLQITAGSAQMFEGGAVPSITASVLGLVNGDDADIVSCSTDATSSSPPGEYDTTCDVDGGNYDAEVTTGTVLVRSVASVVTDAIDDPVLAGQFQDLFSALPTTGPAADAFAAAIAALEEGDNEAAADALQDVAAATADLAIAGDVGVEGLTAVFFLAGPLASSLGGGLIQTAPQMLDPGIAAQMEALQFQAFAALPNGFTDEIGAAFLAAQVAMVGGDVDAALDAYVDMASAAAAIAGDLDQGVLYALFNAAGVSSSLLGGGLLATAPHLADPGLAAQMNDLQFVAAAVLPNGFDDAIGQAFLAAQVAMVGGDVDAALDAYVDMASAAAAIADDLDQDVLYVLFNTAGVSSSLLGGGLLATAPQLADPDLAAQMNAKQFQAAGALPNGFGDAIGQAFLAAQVAMVGGDVDAALAAYVDMVEAAALVAGDLPQEQLYALFDAAGVSSSLLGGGLLAPAPQLADPDLAALMNTKQFQAAASLPNGFDDAIGQAFLAAQVAMVGGDVDAALAAYVDMVEAAALVAGDLPQEQLYALFDAAGVSSSLLGGGLLAPDAAPQLADPVLAQQMNDLQFQAAAVLPNGFGDAIGQAFLAAQVAMVGGNVDAALDAYAAMAQAAADVAGTLDQATLYTLFNTAGVSSSLLGGGLLASDAAPQLADPVLAQQMNDLQFQAAAVLPNGFDDAIGQAFLAAQVAMVGGNVDAALDAYAAMAQAAADVAGTLDQATLYTLFNTAGVSSSLLGGGLLAPDAAPQLADPGLAAQMSAWQFQAAASLPNGFGDAIGQAFLAAQVAMVGGDVDGAVDAFNAMVQAAAAGAAGLTDEQLYGLFGAAGGSVSALGHGLAQSAPAIQNPTVLAQHDAAFATLAFALGGVTGPYGDAILALSVAEVAGDVVAAKTALDDIAARAIAAGGDFAVLETILSAVSTIEVILGAEAQQIVVAPITGAVYGGSTALVAVGGGSGQPVVFTVDPSSSTVCSVDGGVVHHDARGTCVLLATQGPAAGYAPAVPVQVSFDIVMPTSVTFISSATQPSGATTLTVAVADEPGQPVVGGTVTFTAGTLTATVATSAWGTATTSFVLPNGVTTVTATYSGAGYIGSTATQSLTSFQPTQFVVWGGNAGGVSAGGSYLFWGADWHKQVTAGGYTAGASFKGFASDVAANGQSFTARPGNAATPPASISTYVSVLVSTSIGKSGSNVTGNVVRRVVLRVGDVGSYKPAPGGAVSGVLVATVV